MPRAASTNTVASFSSASNINLSNETSNVKENLALRKQNMESLKIAVPEPDMINVNTNDAVLGEKNCSEISSSARETKNYMDSIDESCSATAAKNANSSSSISSCQDVAEVQQTEGLNEKCPKVSPVLARSRQIKEKIRVLQKQFGIGSPLPPIVRRDQIFCAPFKTPRRGIKALPQNSD